MIEPEKKSHAGCIMLVFLAPLPFMYVLSIGPYSWLVNQRHIDPSVWAERFYWPLTQVCEAHEFLRDLLKWYRNLG